LNTNKQEVSKSRLESNCNCTPRNKSGPFTSSIFAQ